MKLRNQYKIKFIILNNLEQYTNTTIKQESLIVVFFMWKIFLIGLSAGFINGLFATGGGMILVPAFIYFLKLNEKEARGTSLFAILPMVITSSVFYYNNYINWNIGILCAIGGIIGGILGVKILKKIPDKILRLFFAFFLIYVAVKMII